MELANSLLQGVAPRKKRERIRPAAAPAGFDVFSSMVVAGAAPADVLALMGVEHDGDARCLHLRALLLHASGADASDVALRAMGE